MQTGILVSQAREPDCYRISVLFKVQVTLATAPLTPVEPVAFAEAWSQVIRRHAIMRTIFAETSCGLMQVVLKDPVPDVRVATVTTLAELESCAEWDQYSEEWLPYRVTIATVSNTGDVYCRFAANHAIDDGSSMQVLLRDLSRAYHGRMSFGPNDEVPLYSDYMAYLLERPSKSAAQFWSTHLAGVEPCHYPTLPQPSSPSSSSSPPSMAARRLLRTEHHFEGEEAQDLHQFCKRFEVTLANLFNVVWALVLRIHVGSDSVCHGYLTSGRDAPVRDVHDMVGPLINMLVFHQPIASHMRLSDLIQAAQDTYIASLPHQHYPLHDIVHNHHLTTSSLASSLSAASDSSRERRPLFNTIVNLQRSLSELLASSSENEGQRSLVFTPMASSDPTEYDINFDIYHHSQGVHLMLSHWDTVLTPVHTARLMRTVVATVRGILDNPTQRVDELSMLESEETTKSQRDGLQESNLGLLYRWNNDLAGDVPEEPESHRRLLHAMIEARIAEQPDAPAVCERNDSTADSTKTLTYRDLGVLSGKLANHLMENFGVGPEVIVPFSFEKSSLGIVAMVAILRAGGACLALDPALTAERKRHILNEIGAGVVVASPSAVSAGLGFEGSVEPSTFQVVVVDDDTISRLDTDASICRRIVTSENDLGHGTLDGPDQQASFIVYTSGSTGQPKGVVLEHRNLHTTTRSLPRVGLTAASRVAHFSSYMYDVSIEETALALTQGACVCVVSEEDRFGDLGAALRAMGVTWMETTPTVARMLEPASVPSLKTLVLGGEMLTDDVAELWLAASDVTLFNTYGPCECAITSTMTDPLTTAAMRNQGQVGRDIGRPVAGTRLWITLPDNPHVLCPPGAVGELLIEGGLVGRGYLGNGDQTRYAFVDDLRWAPASQNQRRRFYRTGDLARWTDGGTIEYLGRRDQQVKLRGQRIELGEIEHHIVQHPEVRIAVAAVPKAGPLRDRLVGLVVDSISPATTAAPSAGHQAPVQPCAATRSSAALMESLRLLLAQKVPRHMVPTFWVHTESIPLLPSGKVNRRLLQQWLASLDNAAYETLVAAAAAAAALLDEAPSSPAKTIAAMPVTPTEQHLVGVWSRILQLAPDRIGVQTPLFNLGGDSVVAMQIMAACRADGIFLTARDIFKNGTIRALAQLWDDKKDLPAQTMTSVAPTIPSDVDMQAKRLLHNIGYKDPAALEMVYPCSPMQESILNAQDKLPNSWYASFTREVASVHDDNDDGMLAASHCLVAAWQRVVDRHAILRTIFTGPGDIIENAGANAQERPHRLRRHQLVLRQHQAEIQQVGSLRTASSPIFPIGSSMPSNIRPPHRLLIGVLEEQEKERAVHTRLFFQLQLSHALYDAVAISCIWDDLCTAFHLVSGSRSDSSASSLMGQELRPPQVTYHDFIDHLEQKGAAAESPLDLLTTKSEAIAHWATYLADMHHLDGRLDFAATALSSNSPYPAPSQFTEQQYHDEQRYRTFHLSLSPSEHRHALSPSNIMAYCRDNGVTAAHLFQAAWALTLSRLTGRSNVVFGVMLSGREISPLIARRRAKQHQQRQEQQQDEEEAIVGPLINLLPLRVTNIAESRLSSPDSKTNMVQTVRDVFIANVLPFQNCSVEDIAEALGVHGPQSWRKTQVRPDSAGSDSHIPPSAPLLPLFDTFLNMQRVRGNNNQDEAEIPSQYEILFPERDSFMVDEYTVSVYVIDSSTKIDIWLNYWTDRLSEEAIKLVADTLCDSLLTLVK